MSAKAAIVWILENDATVSGLVSDRIYNMIAAQNADKPYLVVSGISEAPDYHMTGPTTLMEARYQIDGWQSRASADALGDAIVDAFDTYAAHSADVGPTGNKTYVRSIHVVGRSDRVEEETPGSENFLYGASVDVTVWYST